jgi:hypothetical protein
LRELAAPQQGEGQRPVDLPALGRGKIPTRQYLAINRNRPARLARIGELVRVFPSDLAALRGIERDRALEERRGLAGGGDGRIGRRGRSGGRSGQRRG